MQGQWSAVTSGVVTAVSVVAGATVAVLLLGEVVTGPVARDHAVALVVVTALLLAAAAAATSLVLARASFGWHADGVACAVLVTCLASLVVVGWEHGPVPVRVVGALLAPLAIPGLLHLVERRTRGALGWTLLSGAVISALSVGRYLVRDPFRDPDCWADCSLQGVAPLSSQEAARLLDTGIDLASGTVALVAVWLVLSGAWIRTDRGAVLSAHDLWIAAVAAAAAVLTGLAQIPSGRDARATNAFLAFSAQAVLAVLVALQPARAVHRRHDIRRLALDLGGAPALGTLEQRLARVLGDKDLRVAYWLPESARYVDTLGDAVDTTRPWSISLQRGDQPLALVHLGQSDRDAGELEALIGSATRLAIDSERLQAEQRAQLAELQASRQRIVTAADDTRRAIERSLHDIVQAELLGALYELALLKADAERRGELRVALESASLSEQVRTLVANLREFARGVYPAVLDASGLPAALDALADEAPVVVTVNCRLDPRPPVEVEHAAYLLIHDGVMGAERDVDVDLAWEGSAIVVHIRGQADVVREDLVDRVGSLGGTMTVHDGEVRAELPCG